MRARPPADCAEQITRAYRTMAREVRYRPAAPSDGLGNAYDLNLEAEARAYAHAWWEQEDEGTYLLGCPDYEDRVAMIYALEAGRLCCGGFGSRPAARRLLELALEALS